jgi:myo-inositol-1(or 4)-monophosphatase
MEPKVVTCGEQFAPGGFLTGHLPYGQILARIQDALERAAATLRRFQPGGVEVQYKFGHDPVTEADRSVNEVLRQALVFDGEGWLSEESADDLERLQHDRLWVVDPLDGTREFVQAIPEWCVSVAFVENGNPVAGGILNPMTGETFLGSREAGITLNGAPARVSGRASLRDALVLASRSEVKRGEWKQYEGADFKIRAVGSIAYKLARVAAGLADATWTTVPKNEWDVAAGVALVQAAGGIARTLSGAPLRFNNPSPLLEGLVACSPALYDRIDEVITARRPRS